MKNFLIIAATLLAIIFIGCNNSTTKTVAAAEKTDSINNSTDSIALDTALINYQKTLPHNEGNAPILYPDIKVGEINFDKLCKYIEHNGFSTPQQGVKSDYQYSFRDSRGNKHAFVTIKRNGTEPSFNGKIIQISVWGYAKGVKDQKHFFGYLINRDKILPLTRELDGTWNYYEDVKLGYDEFLAKVRSTK